MVPAAVATGVDFVRRFEEVGIEDVPLVGGKNASLGELARELAHQGVTIFKWRVSIGVQQMIRSDLAASGVMRSIRKPALKTPC